MLNFNDFIKTLISKPSFYTIYFLKVKTNLIYFLFLTGKTFYWRDWASHLRNIFMN